MKYSKWDVNGFERNSAVELYKNGLNPLISVLLASRGISQLDEVNDVISTTAASVHDPFLLADMSKAVARINKAIDLGQRIAIYGDYDVDGMTSSVLLSLWFKSKNVDCEIYIPGRSSEGYGLNYLALDTLKARGVDLLVTVDCGVTAIEEVKHAKELGLDLVITDHHECREELPEAEAVVNPKRPDCSYPFKSLSGVGVAFKLVCALENDYFSDRIINEYSELVALGTIADVMQVTGENRYLIKRGMDVMRKNPRPGLQQLLKEAGSSCDKISTTTISFLLSPRLNAAGRMEKSELSIKLLLSETIEEAGILAKELCDLNSERRNLENAILEEANEMLAGKKLTEPIVLSAKSWHPGVTGIVAAKLADSHGLPTVIISLDDGLGKGSCRSFGSFNIYQALTMCENLFENYGGHEMAAGVTIREDRIAQMHECIINEYEKHIKSASVDGLKLDFEVEKPELLTVENIRALSHLEPFGSGNPSPLLCITDAKLISALSIGDGKHTRLKVMKSGISLECIFFSMPVENLGVQEGMRVDIAFEPQINDFRGKSTVQLQLHDIRPASESIL